MATLTLPQLAPTYPVSPEQARDYQRNGHILLRNILTPDELAVYRQVIVEAAQRHNTETRNMEQRDTYGKAFLQIMNLWRNDEGVQKFTLAERFARLAADLMGVQRVRIYHDQALFKEVGGGPTPWHQDQYYWPIDTTNAVTMWMPLVDISVEMGMLTFASGSQELGFQGNLAISDTSEEVLGDLVRDKGYPVSRAETMQAGDATFHAGWTLHCAPGNASNQIREVMTVIYVAEGARVTKPQNQHQEADRVTWLNSRQPGELIDSVLNPVV